MTATEKTTPMKKLDLPSGRDDITLPDWIALGTASPRKVTPDGTDVKK